LFIGVVIVEEGTREREKQRWDVEKIETQESMKKKKKNEATSGEHCWARILGRKENEMEYERMA
jgi:hypothetical protein